MQKNAKLEKAKQVVSLINSGIEDDNGVVRDFDMLDYYRIIRTSPKTLYETTIDDLRSEFDEAEIKNFNSFVLRSKSNLKLTVKAIMETKHMLIIDDQLREVTDYEKQNVINYLVDSKIPVTTESYAIALKRYLHGQMELDNKNKTSIK